MTHATTILLAAVLVITSEVSAENLLSETEMRFIGRLAAVAYPEVIRSMCKDQTKELKERAEAALTSSGLTRFSQKDVCANELCKSINRDGGMKIDEANIPKMIESFREDQVAQYTYRSKQGLEKMCTSSISVLEQLKIKPGQSAEDIMAEILSETPEK